MGADTRFTANYDRWMEPLERRWFGAIRAGLLRHAAGETLEIGCGTGVNFPYYPKDVHLTAIEPNASFRRKAELRAETLGRVVRISDAPAERLPFPDGAFDTVVGTLVFCTIQGPAEALREAARVCRPGGKLLLFEHVLHSNAALAALQHALTPVWRRLCDGCRLNRDTERLVRETGWALEWKETHLGNVFVVLSAVRSGVEKG